MKNLLPIIALAILTSCGEQKRESKLGAPAEPVAQTKTYRIHTCT